MPQHYPGRQPDFMSDIDRIFARTKTAAHRGGLGSIGGGELGPIGTGGYNPQAMMQRLAQLEQEGRLFDPDTGQPLVPYPTNTSSSWANRSCSTSRRPWGPTGMTP